MASAEERTNGLEAALVTARTEYRQAVIELAEHEACKTSSSDRELSDVDRIHHARTRVIALEAARDELSRVSDEAGLAAN